jgi:hypothetical protein
LFLRCLYIVSSPSVLVLCLFYLIFLTMYFCNVKRRFSFEPWLPQQLLHSSWKGLQSARSLKKYNSTYTSYIYALHWIAKSFFFFF